MHRLTEWIPKQDPAFFCIQETHFSDKDRHYLRVKGWKKSFPSKWSQEKAGIALLISNEIDFQLKVIKRDGEEHYIVIKGKKMLRELVKLSRVHIS